MNKILFLMFCFSINSFIAKGTPTRQKAKQILKKTHHEKKLSLFSEKTLEKKVRFTKDVLEKEDLKQQNKKDSVFCNRIKEQNRQRAALPDYISREHAIHLQRKEQMIQQRLYQQRKHHVLMSIQKPLYIYLEHPFIQKHSTLRPQTTFEENIPELIFLNHNTKEQATEFIHDHKEIPFKQPMELIYDDESPAFKQPMELIYDDESSAFKQPMELIYDDESPAFKQPMELIYDDERPAFKQPMELIYADERPAFKQPMELIDADERPAFKQPMELIDDDDESPAFKQPMELIYDDESPAFNPTMGPIFPQSEAFLNLFHQKDLLTQKNELPEYNKKSSHILQIIEMTSSFEKFTLN